MPDTSAVRGLILCGGRGTRLRPLTYTRAKQLIPIANKPTLFYVVEDLVEAGIRDIGVVVSPETGSEVEEALGAGGTNPWNARFSFILQEQPLGLAHAVKTARPYLEDRSFVMYLGDNLLSGGIARLVEDFVRSDLHALVLLTPVKDPTRFGVAVVDGRGRVTRLVEKPRDPPSDLALVGVYVFHPIVHEVIENLRPSRRGEYEITDAIQGLLDRGCRVRAHTVRGWWKDTGRPEDLLDANRLLLSRQTGRIRGEVVDSEVTGEVVVEEKAKVVRSVVRGPVHVAAGAVIEDSYVGPYTSVGRNARIRSSNVEYSIILDESEISDLPCRLDAALLGQGVVVRGGGNRPLRHSLRLVLGDRSVVSL